MKKILNWLFGRLIGIVLVISISLILYCSIIVIHYINNALLYSNLKNEESIIYSKIIYFDPLTKGIKKDDMNILFVFNKYIDPNILIKHGIYMTTFNMFNPEIDNALPYIYSKEYNLLTRSFGDIIITPIYYKNQIISLTDKTSETDKIIVRFSKIAYSNDHKSALIYYENTFQYGKISNFGLFYGHISLFHKENSNWIQKSNYVVKFVTGYLGDLESAND